jgi:hypothetical protein
MGPPPRVRAGPPPRVRAGPPPRVRAGPPPRVRAGPPPGSLARALRALQGVSGGPRTPGGPRLGRLRARARARVRFSSSGPLPGGGPCSCFAVQGRCRGTWPGLRAARPGSSRGAGPSRPGRARAGRLRGSVSLSGGPHWHCSPGPGPGGGLVRTRCGSRRGLRCCWRRLAVRLAVRLALRLAAWLAQRVRIQDPAARARGTGRSPHTHRRRLGSSPLPRARSRRCDGLRDPSGAGSGSESRRPPAGGVPACPAMASRAAVACLAQAG